jgi:hypothetical protein
MIQTVQVFETLKDKRKTRTVVKILNDAAAGKKISDARINRAQEFLAGFLEEINSKRPRPQPVCRSADYEELPDDFPDDFGHGSFLQ